MAHCAVSHPAKAANGKLSLVARVKQGFNLADGTAESDKTFRDIRATAKLIIGDYFDYTKPYSDKSRAVVSRAVKDCTGEIPELIPFCFNANYRLLGVHLRARDLLMLLCQDESRNRSRKSNAAKKQRGEEVRLGRRTTSQGCHLLSISYI